ncbi:MAG: M23 family metallopeptidase [Clostridiales bacterium]|nr:M23 family metallopeptidase [Clostridiales bacterium]
MLISICAFISGKCLTFLGREQAIRDALSQEIDYDQFRNIRIDKKHIDQIIKYRNRLVNKNPDYAGCIYIDDIGYLTFTMMVRDYDLRGKEVPNEKFFMSGIGRLSSTNTFRELYGYYQAIFSDIRYFPVPYMRKGAANISYADTWYAPRSYGGDRKHEGTDLMASNNLPGYFPIISITDGVVENMGWLEQGGYRVGIRSESGGYFYYAHLDTYAPGLKEGDTVIAGQLLGFMGDSGYGKEGTKGQFDVHLHLGIYVQTDRGEMSVNPYCILGLLEHSRTELIHN